MVVKHMTIRKLLQIGKHKLKNPHEAGFLLMSAAQISKTELLIGDLIVPPKVEETYLNYIIRRTNGEPIEYITNSAEFFGHTFYVDPNVLIPRDETEILVETAIDALRKIENPTILDVGTGSGCIAISLALAISSAQVFAVDISPGALEVARHNANVASVSNRIKFIQCDVLQAFPSISNLDMTISNPPYIARNDSFVDTQVHRFEPHSALYANDDGLEFYKCISANVNAKMLAFEVGYNQAATVAEFIKTTAKFNDIKIIPDFSGIDRVVIAN